MSSSQAAHPVDRLSIFTVLYRYLSCYAYRLWCILWLVRVCFFSPKQSPWSPYNAQDLPASKVQGKVIAITGSSSGIGEEAVRALRRCILSDNMKQEDEERKVTKIFLLVRNVQKMETILTQLRHEDGCSSVQEEEYGLEFILIECDMADLKSIHSASQVFLRHSTSLDILFCNSGIVNREPFAETVQGWEIDFGVNALANHALIKFLIPALQNVQQPRIIFTNSMAAFWIRRKRGTIRFYFYPFELALKGRPQEDVGQSDGDQWFQDVLLDKPFAPIRPRLEFPVNTTTIYARSKLAAIASARYWEYHKDIICISVHPGVIRTSIMSPYSTSKWKDKIIDLICQPCHTTSSGKVGFGAVNLLYAAFGIDAYTAQNAYIQEWCESVDLETQDYWINGGDQSVQIEWEKLQRQLPEWMNEVIDGVINKE
ncbi:unnamed protein product [Sympodiomycopsis kandeliae]